MKKQLNSLEAKEAKRKNDLERARADLKKSEDALSKENKKASNDSLKPTNFEEKTQIWRLIKHLNVIFIEITIIFAWRPSNNYLFSEERSRKCTSQIGKEDRGIGEGSSRIGGEAES